MEYDDTYNPNEREPYLEELEDEEDWSAVVDLYLKWAEVCLVCGDNARAHMWFCNAHIAILLYADMGGFDPFEDERYDGIREQMDALDRYPDLIYAMEEDICSNYEKLSRYERFHIGFFTLCRLEKLFNDLSANPGCAPLSEISWVIDWLQTLDATDENLERFEAFYEFLQNWNVSEAYVDTRQHVRVPGRPAFLTIDFELDQVCDLIYEYLRSIRASIATPDLRDADYFRKLNGIILDPVGGPFVVRAALLTGYWLRTYTGHIQDLPQVMAELNCIQDDFRFLMGNPTAGAIQERIARYRNWDLFLGMPAFLDP